jgi:hypothetical protein
MEDIMKGKLIVKITLVLIALLFLAACGEETKTPANVELSDTTFYYQWLGTYGQMVLSGTATNSGESTAYTVQVMVTLYNSSKTAIAESTWKTIFDALGANNSLGFNTYWTYTSRYYESASYYKADIQWGTAQAAVEDEEQFIGEYSLSTGLLPIE